MIDECIYNYFILVIDDILSFYTIYNCINKSGMINNNLRINNHHLCDYSFHDINHGIKIIPNHLSK